LLWEKEKWDHLVKMKSAAKKAIKIFEGDLKDPKNKQYKKIIENEIAFEKRIIEIISQRIPE
jgi:phosphate uptake regulator